MDKRTDLVGVMLIVGLGVWYYALAGQLPDTRMGDPLGPRGFPKYLAVGIITTALFLFIRQIRKWSGTPGWKHTPEGESDDPAFSASGARVIGLITLTFAYLALLIPLGYLLATPVFLTAVLTLLGIRRPRVLAAVSVGMTLVLFVVFVLLARIYLPLGPMDFISDWIMHMHAG